MNDRFKKVVDEIDLFLRAIASGFVTLLAIILADSSGSTLNFFEANIWRGIGLAIVLGFTTYSIHTSVLEDLFMTAFILPLIRCRHKNEIPADFQLLSRWEAIAMLSRERWSRRASKDKRVMRMQEQLDRDYAWLIFLYCSSYSLIISPFLIVNRINIRFCLFVIIFAVAVFTSAIWKDIKITRHELWLCMNFPQFSSSD